MVTNHKVKIQKWLGGKLETIERFFTREEDARNFIKNEHKEGYISKIYDRKGELLHVEGAANQDTYA